MRDYTDITVVLDRSGSMANIRAAMEEGFNAFLKKHKEIPSTRISLVQFDTTNPYETVYTAIPINEAPKLSLVPRGGTPLLDALCRTIDATGERLSGMRETERPKGVLFVVITDGEENSSTRFTRADVKTRIEHQSNKYAWDFIYLGANQDAIKEAESFGISALKAINYVANAFDTEQKIGGLVSNTVNYAMARSRGLSDSASSATLNWTDEQRKEKKSDDS